MMLDLLRLAVATTNWPQACAWMALYALLGLALWAMSH
jgi:hypothetical protein